MRWDPGDGRTHDRGRMATPGPPAASAGGWSPTPGAGGPGGLRRETTEVYVRYHVRA